MSSGYNTQAVFEIGECIGTGMYGLVFQGRYNTRKAAIKKFRLHQHTTDQAKIIQQEIGLLNHLQHHHIIQFYGVHRQGNEIFLATDFAEGGSLKQAIEDSRVADWHVKSRIAQEIADGLAYIHREGILHRDLKSDNVLLTGLLEVRLCDFGLAVVKTSSYSHSTELIRGTFRWLAPEFFLSEQPPYTTKSDMYAFGMVMWEMAAMCTLPFRTISHRYVVAQAVHRGRREQLPHEIPAIYRRWVNLCWKHDPSERPDAHDMIILDNVSILDDASSVHQDANIAGTSGRALIDNFQDQGMAIEMMPSMPEEPRAVQPLMEVNSLSRTTVRNEADAQVSLVKLNAMSTADLGRMQDNASRGPEQSDMEVVRWCATAANQGDPSGQFNLGWMYEMGRGVQQSDVKAVKWYTKAASQKDPRGQFNLGWMYEHGRGVKQNDDEAVKWYTKSASQGNPDAQKHLERMHETGRGVQKSDIKAFKWYTKAASQGNSNAQNSLGFMYEQGRGVEQSDVEAVKWYGHAASQGHPGGQFNLGWMYLSGRGLRWSYVEAVKWFAKAASQGCPDGQYNLGWMYENGRGVEQNDVEAVKWYTKAASQGHPNAQYNLGWMYDLGQGVKQDDTIAVEWYKKSSNRGVAYAHGGLASMYELGFGIEASDDHALDLFTKANDEGDPNAHFHIQWLTSPDRRTPCSDSDAVEVNRIGAEKGYVAAQHNLGRLYERGRGVDMDKGQALAWYSKAAAQDHLDSQQRMEFLQRQ